MGLGISVGEKRWRSLNLYDEKINELKNIIKKEDVFQQGKGTRVLENLPFSVIYDKKLFLAWENDFIIKVLDTELKELYTIKYDVVKRKVTEEDKKDIINFLKTSPATKDFFELLKPIHFPTQFPAMQGLFVTDNEIYAVTFKTNDEKEINEFLIFDIKGKFLKQGFFPFKMSTPILPYPYTIHEGFLYQLVEDVDEEEWALHVTEIK